MEKNEQHDPLDEYVRNTFDDHEESPASNMWSRIEGELPAALPAWRVFFLNNRLQLAAACILLLLSGLVCEHYYYENKLKALVEEGVREQPHPQPPDLSTGQALPRMGGRLNPEKGEASGVEFDGLPSSTNQNTTRDLPSLAQRGGGLYFEKGRASGVEFDGLPSSTNQNATRDLTPLPPGGGPVPYLSREVAQPIAQTQPAQQTTTPTIETPQVSSTTRNDLPSSTKQNTTPDLPPLAQRGGGLDFEKGRSSGVEFDGLPPSTKQNATRDLTPLPFGGGDGGGVAHAVVQIQPASVALPPINPAHTLSGWYVGLHATPHRTLESATATAQRPGMRPVFVSQSERPDVATDWWFRVGKTTGRRFGLESGIGFSESTRTTVHTARFRFADGAIHPGGPVPGQRRNFTYNLSTYGGSASVNLRMESADDSVPVADAEPVAVKVSTTEQARLLRIPLLLSYRMGAGRVQAVAKAGLTGNFFLKNELAISARASQNNRLRFAQSADNFVFERTNTFFLGYWASAGIEFRWNRRLSIVAEPAVSGNFARQDAQGHRLPDHLLAGVNVGLNWRL